MIEELTPDAIASDIMLLRDEHQGAFLLVEGYTDSKFFKKFTDETMCRIKTAHGKECALATAEILNDRGMDGIMIIVDADYWLAEETEPSSPNVLMTDTHDLETMLLNSPALENVLIEYGNEEKIAEFVERCPPTIRDALLTAGTPVGYLRWVSIRNELGFVFEGLNFGKFVDSETLAVGLNELFIEIRNHSCKHDLTLEELEGLVEELQDNDINAWHICCGHDLVCVLSHGLRRALGSNNAGDVKPEKLEKMLRMAYEADYFQDTMLCRAIIDWQERTGYSVLKESLYIN